jgi:hypothetical protein
MKYELLRTPEHTIEVDGRKLYRIRALDPNSLEVYLETDEATGWKLGGHLESENNLAQNGTCWVFSGGKVYGHAEVSDSALVRKGATVSAGTILCGKSKLGAGVQLKNNVIRDVNLNGPLLISDTSPNGLRLNVSDRELTAGPVRITALPIIISNSWHQVVVSDNYLTLGCTTLTLAEWQKVTEDKIANVYGGSRSAWRQWKDILFAIAEKHQARFAP